MSKNVKIKLNRKGVAAVMKSEEAQAMLGRYGARIQGKCGSGYTYDVHVGKNRANVMIKAETLKAKISNSKNNTLLKALGG